MKDKHRWLLFAAAVILMAVNWLVKDRSALERLSPADFWPVLILSAVVFLVKTGVLTALFLGLKKLWDKIKKK